jgi:hypothetical protein
MPAANHDILIEQGATFRLELAWKIDGAAVDLTGYGARMQVRGDAASESAMLSLTSSGGGGIVLGGAGGTISVTASAAQTAALVGRSGVYDLELESPGAEVTRLVQGHVEISPQVTR